MNAAVFPSRAGTTSAARAGRWLYALAVAVLIMLVSGSAWADKVDRLAEKLRNADDFRVRTQAALALGASKSSRAVDPLCDGLDDSNTTVRAAAAAGLGKLRKGGVECLEKALGSEQSDSVKAVIKKSIRRIKKKLGGALGPGSKVYIAVEVTNKTSLRDGRVTNRVRKGADSALRRMEGWVLAPDGETPDEAKKLLAKHSGVDAFFLSPKVKSKSAGGVTKVKLEVAVFTYPGKALKGMFSITVGMEGEESDDLLEDLIKEASKAAFKKFASNSDRFK